VLSSVGDWALAVSRSYAMKTQPEAISEAKHSVPAWPEAGAAPEHVQKAAERPPPAGAAVDCEQVATALAEPASAHPREWPRGGRAAKAWRRPPTLQDANVDELLPEPLSAALATDWVIVNEVTPGATQPAPEGPSVKAAAATVAASGAAGLLLLGPLSGAALAAGAAYTVLGEAGVGAGHEGLRACDWATSLGVPQDALGRVDGAGVLRQLSGTAKVASSKVGEAMGELNRVAELLGHGLKSVGPALSGAALAEKERAIVGLARELEVSERAGLRARGQFVEQLGAAERAAAEERARLTESLEAARLATAAEAERLAAMEAAERAKARDCARLARELEDARHAGEEERERLWKELRDSESAMEQERELLARELEAAERRRETECSLLARELEAERQLSSELETMRRAREEVTCCICMERQRQVLFLPCRHVCCCGQCARELGKCPVDRTRIEEQIQFTMA